LKNFLNDESHLDTRVRNEVIVCGESTRKRFLKSPFTILLKKFKEEKNPGVCIMTLHKIYMENFSTWLSLADNNSILSCVCPVHLQADLFVNAVNRVSQRAPIEVDQLLQTSFCHIGQHRLQCLENACDECGYNEVGYELAKAKVSELLELIEEHADITYAHLNKVDRTDTDGKKYSREQIFMQQSSKDEFIELLTMFLMQGSSASGAGFKSANHFELAREDYEHSRALRTEASYSKDMVLLSTDYGKSSEPS